MDTRETPGGTGVPPQSPVHSAAWVLNASNESTLSAKVCKGHSVMTQQQYLHCCLNPHREMSAPHQAPRGAEEGGSGPPQFTGNPLTHTCTHIVPLHSVSCSVFLIFSLLPVQQCLPHFVISALCTGNRVNWTKLKNWTNSQNRRCVLPALRPHTSLVFLCLTVARQVPAGPSIPASL